MAISLLEVDIDTTAKAVASSLGYRDIVEKLEILVSVVMYVSKPVNVCLPCVVK